MPRIGPLEEETHYLPHGLEHDSNRGDFQAGRVRVVFGSGGRYLRLVSPPGSAVLGDGRHHAHHVPDVPLPLAGRTYTIINMWHESREEVALVLTMISQSMIRVIGISKTGNVIEIPRGKLVSTVPPM